jgi:hypothetical protein
MPHDLKLIIENRFTPESELDLLVEDNDGQKKYIVRGPYIIAEEKNANGRIYNAEVMAKSVEEYTQKLINTKRSVGEMNHPDTVEVDFEKACHRILSLKREGNIWMGESQILTGTPMGDLYAGLIRGGVSTGMSTRGVGNVNADGIVDEFTLVAVDVVSNPSGPGAFVEGILESKNFLIDQHGEIVERAYTTLEGTISTLPVTITERNEKIFSALSNFISNI